MIYNNEEISKLFQEESIHVLDYDMEYDSGIPCLEKFPEYDNKIWKFFNTDSGMTTGHFTFGDLESGATMNLKVKLMLFFRVKTVRIIHLPDIGANFLVQDHANPRRLQIPGRRAVLHLQLRCRDHPQWRLQRGSSGRRKGVPLQIQTLPVPVLSANNYRKVKIKQLNVRRFDYSDSYSRSLEPSLLTLLSNNG